ncbi:MAG: hypothetical protein WBA84_01285 [Carnobacterium sp.]
MNQKLSNFKELNQENNTDYIENESKILLKPFLSFEQAEDYAEQYIKMVD